MTKHVGYKYGINKVINSYHILKVSRLAKTGKDIAAKLILNKFPEKI